jgi:hypothetical protein
MRTLIHFATISFTSHASMTVPKRSWLVVENLPTVSRQFSRIASEFNSQVRGWSRWIISNIYQCNRCCFLGVDVRRIFMHLRSVSTTLLLCSHGYTFNSHSTSSLFYSRTLDSQSTSTNDSDCLVIALTRTLATKRREVSEKVVGTE